MHVVFLIMLQVLTLMLIGYTSLRKRSNLKNELLLLCFMVLGLLHVILADPFSTAEEYFIMVALMFIIPTVGFMAMLVVIFASRNARVDAVKNRTYLDEVKRKAFHFVALAMFVPREIYRQIYEMVIDGTYVTFGIMIEKRVDGFLCFLLFAVVFSLLILFSVIEFLRLNFKPTLFGSLLREKELNQLASYFYSAVAIYLVVLFFFPYDVIVSAAIAMGFLADLVACLIGMRLHRIKFGDRSVEGTVANLIAGIIVGYYFVGWVAVPAALIIAVFDFVNGGFGLNLNDNLLFPLIAAAFLVFFGAASF